MVDIVVIGTLDILITGFLPFATARITNYKTKILLTIGVVFNNDP